MKTGIDLITEERKRHPEIGYNAEHDDTHINGEIADGAALYAMSQDSIDYINQEWGNDRHLHFWPFDLKSLKPLEFEGEGRIKQLAKAGAMIAAEIDRLKRL